MPDDPALALDALLTRLGAVLSGSGSSSGPTDGADASGLARARIGADGRVTSIDLDPALLRDRPRIGAAIAEAVNDALAARPTGQSEPAAFRAELRAVQEASVQVGRELNNSLLSTLESLRSR